ncbi:export ABC transporter ATP-binding protein [Tissierella sp. P1]|jgi:ABC-2 type transport system ATP-binding protein|uniref:ABC transporter ATP-binding protein n=1 Tax=Tissierella TaxID=41273 RepID=UPI000B9FB894|nr:ABC transporter ATP-binding protein [Tissierella sp. P1]MDU5080682.1 ABC transporter ATP-binding protein [Bacillota bacterium]OZV10916.1 export ABC transporter ATP-binding protein [Tissierella sp. P1]
MNIIEVKNISKKFDDKLVLDNISFSVETGDIFGLIGPNGAGKSTLINIMTGLLDANKGSITIGGFDIKKESIKAKEFLGLVPQELALMETVSAYDNLEFFGSLYGLKGKLLKERINYALDITGLTEKRKDKVKKFSGGMKRRLNLAAAIMHEPKILILDEPTVGIDPQSRNHIFEFIKGINKEKNTTILYTSHYMEEVEYLCNNIFIIDEGKEIAYGSKKTVKSMISNNNKVNLRIDNINKDLINNIKLISGVVDCENSHDEINLLVEGNSFKLEPLLKVLESNKSAIKSINVDEPNLEEVFLALTGKKLRD